MSRVMIHPASYDDLKEAIEKVFDLFPLKCEGKRVLLKPNLLRASRPDEGIITHPAFLRAVVEKIESFRPALLTVGDNPGVFCYGSNEEAFRTSGLMEAAGTYYSNIGNESRQVDFNPDFAAKISFSAAVLDADIVVSLPKFKTHGLTVITGAIKNSYGFLPGAQKAQFHRTAGSAERFQDMLVDVFKIRVPDLFIVDAIVGMEGNGPASPDLRDIGLVLASDNAVAIDTVIAHMMGIDQPERLRFLRKAKEAGLGDYDINKIEIVGALKRLENFKLPPFSGEVLLRNKPVNDFLEQRTLMRPDADPDLCTGCGTCADQCPMTALTIVNGMPAVDRGKCIACFCCQEICPEKAITLK